MKLELRIVDLLARSNGKRFTINEIATALKEFYSLVHRTISKLVKDGVIVKERAGKSHLCSLNMASEKTLTLIQLSEIEKKDEFLGENRELKLVLEDFVRSVESKTLSIVLFGSYAKGTATAESDIDILLIGRAGAETDKIAREIYAKYGKDVSIIEMTPDEFKKQREKAVIKEIIHDHYVLYGVEKFVNMVFK